MCKFTGARSSSAPGAGVEGDANGLSEPLLACGDCSLHDVPQAMVVEAKALGDDARVKGAGNKEKDRFWEDVPPQNDAVVAAADPVTGGSRRPLLFTKKEVRAAVLFPYRILILARLVTVILFIGWRIKHNKSDLKWFWVTSVVADVWFAFSWLLC